ncbi:MAG: hypothetical protein HY803_07625, partial [candidate division NC10 bacterium]|nr:hypothetical protein [candidate division NC10 bacterium]
MPSCWKCHRDLGPMLEHQKMVTEKGPICYACFNALQEEAKGMAALEALERKLAASPGLRRAGGLLLLLFAGWMDYITGPEIASAPFYILVILPIAFFEPLWICLAYSVLAAFIYLTSDILSTPGSVTLVYPYWRAVARLFSFALISSTISQLLGERRRLCDSDRSLLEKARELEEKNRYLGELLGQVMRLQEELVAKERRAAIAETVNSATYEIERPLVSISVHVEDLLRSVKPHEDIYPLVEKI